jgi:NhaP-type Na+/H+ or K+/H+ antiporter
VCRLGGNRRFIPPILNKTMVTLPIVFTGLGYLVVNPVEQLAETETLHEIARTIAEVTLILVLFADASHVRFSQLAENYKIPLRMLIIGMLLTILLGTIVVIALPPEQSWAVAFLTAAILTPTDAALGQVVVSSPDVPPRLSQSINVESGLNDGLALPFILLAAILAGAAGMAETHDGSIAMVALKQVVLGPLVGIFVGWLIARALDYAQNVKAISISSQGVVFLCTAFAAFLLSEEIGGNGFISAFVAGAVFGNVYKHDITFISELMESQGQLLTMAAFFIFGSVLLPAGIEHMSWIPVVVALLFLSVVRMLPIAISLIGTGLPLKEKLFLGWFGPRGLASILFSLIIIDEYEIPHEEELLACVVMTVFLSIVLHGITANPLVRRIARL